VARNGRTCQRWTEATQDEAEARTGGVKEAINENQTTDIINNIQRKPLIIPFTHKVQIDSGEALPSTNTNLRIKLYTEPSFFATVNDEKANISNYQSDGQSCTFKVGKHTVIITGPQQKFFKIMNECADKFKAR